MTARARLALLAAAALGALPPAAKADDAPAGETGAAPSAPVFRDGREYLVPDLAEGAFAIDPGPRRFLDRLSFSPAFGRLGNGKLYAVRASYHPHRWLGWEASLAHNPGQSVHALLHTLDAVLRYPLPGRIQPYGTLGYGMILVFPGESLNTDPVTDNVLSAGGGVEIYIRNDLALRIDARHLTIPGSGGVAGGTVAYDYAEFTAGLSFYRGLSR
jgi:Outer membrane protein beta-barrel domain